MAAKKITRNNHLKKPVVLLVIGLSIMAVFWISFVSITTKTNTNSQAAEIGARYAAGQIIFGVESGKTPSASTIRSVTGYSDATIKKLYNNIYLLKSSNLRNKYNSLSSSSRSASSTTAIDTYTSQAISKLESISYVTEAVPDQQIEFLAIPNDPNYIRQWAMTQIEAPAAWDLQNNNEVVVGVMDTGVEATHPDIINNMWINYAEKNGKAGVDDDKNGVVDDDYGFPVGQRTTFDNHPEAHGTHVAGIIAAQWNNATGVAGTCPNCKIMTLKVLEDAGRGHESNIIMAMAYAIKQKKNGVNLKVINHSYAFKTYDLFMEEMFSTADREGIISVAAAGNTGNLMVGVYPAQFTRTDMVFSVLATTYADKKASFSSYGKTDDFVDFSAPGDDIYSLSKTGYQNMDGTSMASPHVAGVIAMMASIKPNLTYQDAKTILKSTVDNIDSLNHSSFAGYLGFGRINARKALERTWNDVGGAQNPTPTKTPTPTPKATATSASGYTLSTTNPKAGNTYAAPLNLPVGGTISGNAAYTTARIDLQIFKYPISTNVPLASKVITDFTNSNGVYSFSSWFSTNITTPGEYVIQIVPRGSTGTIIGSHKEIRFFVENIPTKTPTPTPRSGSISPTGIFR